MTLYESLFVILWINSDVFCLQVLEFVFSFTACPVLSVLRSLVFIFIHIYAGRGVLFPDDKRRKMAYPKRVCTLFHNLE